MSFKKITQLSTAGLITILLASYGGGLHPLGDSLAVFRVQICFALILSLLVSRQRILIAAGTCLVLLTLISRLSYQYAPEPETPTTFTVYQKNMSFRIPDVQPLTADIQKAGVDFVMLQEVTNRNTGMMKDLSPSFKNQHLCPFSAVGGTAILSKWPVIEGTRKCFAAGMTSMQVRTSNGPVWIISIHMNWPYPYGQADQSKKIYPLLEGLSGPKIIAGDFNMVPWSHLMRGFQTASDTRRIGSVLPSLNLPTIKLAIPIDHVLAPKACVGKTERRLKLGSDHDGILAEISCP